MTGGRWSLPRLTRDGVLFAGGLIGIINEAVIRDTPRDSLLVLFAAMSISPTFLAVDEANRARRRANESKPEEESQ